MASFFDWLKSWSWFIDVIAHLLSDIPQTCEAWSKFVFAKEKTTPCPLSACFALSMAKANMLAYLMNKLIFFDRWYLVSVKKLFWHRAVMNPHSILPIPSSLLVDEFYYKNRAFMLVHFARSERDPLIRDHVVTWPDLSIIAHGSAGAQFIISVQERIAL